MAFLVYNNVNICGITASVPSSVERVADYPYFTNEEVVKFSKATGVISRHVDKQGITASDLCYHAAEKLLDGIGWEKETIDGLIFVSQTRDYILPCTSCILQNRLGLSDECYALDIPYGCSGYIYGLQTASALLHQGQMKRLLLLVGDVVTPHHNIRDKSSYPLFGDAGTATAIEFKPGSKPICFHMGTDGGGADAIMIRDGGYRNRVNADSFILHDCHPDGSRTNLDCALKGLDVFSFGISRAPESVNKLLNKYQLSLDGVDYFVMHQANKFLNERIRKKLQIGIEKTPYCLGEYGNTSCASIPLTLTSCLNTEVSGKQCHVLFCGFGVGLSWGSVYCCLDHIYCVNTFEYEL